MFHLRPLLCASLLALAPASLPAADGLQPNDLVAICGDSITELGPYPRFIEDYLLMCQPQPGLQAFQAGWSGESATAFSLRVANDVLPFGPTVATTCYGMNDGGHAPLTPERAAQYRAAIKSIVGTLKQGGVRLVVIGGPGVVDSTTYTRIAPEIYNKTLSELSAIAREVAEQNGAIFADVHTPMLAAMTAAKAKYGPAYHIAPDSIHPGPNGHLVMAYAFLKALGCDGAIGTITYDPKSSQATATDGHKIQSVNNGSIEVESTRYPFCFVDDPAGPTATRSIMEFVPFNQELNRFLLVVKNAPAAKCQVTWGTVTKEFSATDLAKGINLAVEFLDNPFSKSFQTVDSAVARQQQYDVPANKLLLHSLMNWKQGFPENTEHYTALARSVVDKGAALRSESCAAVIPVKHTLTVAPVK